MSDFWFGSEAAWDVVVQAQAQVDEMIKQGRTPSENKSGLPVLWERVGDTALVHIAGSLINGSAGWMRYFGVVGYDDLARGALEAAADPETKKMLFLVDSGGGMVAGLADYARFLEKISRVKPSMVYTATKIGSAAYWSASSVSGPIMMDATAEVGSIGAVMVTMDRSKQFETNGIKPTVIKSGDLKMTGNPFEPLSEEAKAHLQGQIDDLNSLFQAQVKAKRPGMTQANLDQVARGQTFLGKRAVAVGLADSIGSFEQALKLLDKNSSQKHTSTNSKGATMPKYNLTEDQLNRLMAGATLKDLGIEEEADDKKTDAAAKAAETAAAAADKDEATLAAEKAAKDKADADEAAKLAAAAKTATDGVTAYVQKQLDAKTAELVTAQAELATMKASMTAMQATHDGLMGVARKATTRLLVPMGGTEAAVAAMDAKALIDKYAETEAAFVAKFPVGGVSERAKADDGKSETAVPASFRTLKARNATK